MTGLMTTLNDRPNDRPNDRNHLHARGYAFYNYYGC